MYKRQLLARYGKLSGPPMTFSDLKEKRSLLYGGRCVHKGFPAGTVLGPVKEVCTTRFPPQCKWQNGWTMEKQQFVSCRVPDPTSARNKDVWVNVWTSVNKEGDPVGIDYCDVLMRDDVSLSPTTLNNALEPSVLVAPVVEREVEAVPLASVTSLEPSAAAGQPEPISEPGPIAEQAERKEPDETVDKDEPMVVSPLLPADAVVDLLLEGGGQDVASKAARIRSNIFTCQDLPVLHIMSDQQIVEATEEAEVFFATGGSDSETIRDQESGPAPVRWHRRSPYWYRIEPCTEHGGSFRRLMKAKEKDVELQWETEYASDDEGYVPQPSFILKSTAITDEAGSVVADVTDAPSKDKDHTDEAWKTEFGTDFPVLTAIRDSVRETDDDKVDQELLDIVLTTFRKICREDGIAIACDDLLDTALRGMPKPVVGSRRCVEGCIHCKGSMFSIGERDNSEEVPWEICPYCDNWIHARCLDEHVIGHVEGMLCRALDARLPTVGG